MKSNAPDADAVSWIHKLVRGPREKIRLKLNRADVERANLVSPDVGLHQSKQTRFSALVAGRRLDVDADGTTIPNRKLDGEVLRCGKLAWLVELRIEQWLVQSLLLDGDSFITLWNRIDGVIDAHAVLEGGLRRVAW